MSDRQDVEVGTGVCDCTFLPFFFLLLLLLVLSQSSRVSLVNIANKYENFVSSILRALSLSVALVIRFVSALFELEKVAML